MFFKLQEGYKRAHDRNLTPSQPNLDPSWEPWEAENAIRIAFWGVFAISPLFA